MAPGTVLKTGDRMSCELISSRTTLNTASFLRGRFSLKFGAVTEIPSMNVIPEPLISDGTRDWRAAPKLLRLPERKSYSAEPEPGDDRTPARTLGSIAN